MHLFSESTVNQLSLKNRIVRSAAWEGMCDPDGQPTQRLIDLYRKLAAGGVGLIVTPGRSKQRSQRRSWWIIGRCT